MWFLPNDNSRPNLFDDQLGYTMLKVTVCFLDPSNVVFPLLDYTFNLRSSVSMLGGPLMSLSHTSGLVFLVMVPTRSVYILIVNWIWGGSCFHNIFHESLTVVEKLHFINLIELLFWLLTIAVGTQTQLPASERPSSLFISITDWKPTPAIRAITIRGELIFFSIFKYQARLPVLVT